MASRTPLNQPPKSVLTIHFHIADTQNRSLLPHLAFFYLHVWY